MAWYNLFIYLSVAFAALTGVGEVRAAPCLSTTSECTELVKISNAPGGLLIYRTHPLEVRNEALTNALIVVHGISRDADNYFRHAQGAGFFAGALDRAIIISPRFAAEAGNALTAERSILSEVSTACESCPMNRARDLARTSLTLPPLRPRS
jgi:hypothetical protein